MIHATTSSPEAISAKVELPPSTLVICTRNRSQMLMETVNSILEANEVPSELLIIDQSDIPQPSLDGLKNDRGCIVRHVCLDKVGASLARNVGFRDAQHDIVAFIDDDMWVAPDWYGELITALLKGGPRSVVTGRVVPAPSGRPEGFVIAVHDWEEPGIYTGRIYRDVLASGHMAIYRSAYTEIGGFDERLGPGTRFPGAEDNDFGFRLLEAGYSLLYLPDSMIYHRAWRSRSDYVPLFWSYGRGQGAFYAKHWHWGDHYMLKRAWNDLRRYLKLLPQRLWRKQLLVLSGSTVFLLGEYTSALEWLFGGHKRRL